MCVSQILVVTTKEVTVIVDRRVVEVERVIPLPMAARFVMIGWGDIFRHQDT
jgi:hypothetical protein